LYWPVNAFIHLALDFTDDHELPLRKNNSSDTEGGRVRDATCHLFNVGTFPRKIHETTLYKG
jgi:hypothetical protein